MAVNAARGPALRGLPIRALGPLLRRPDLWPTAVRQASVLAAPGWWRRAPFLPLPAPDYLRFRLITAYGGDGAAPGRGDPDGAAATGRDLVAYLAWCRTRPLG
ncbi:MAG: hypothetical protein JST64_10755 [Actinobacteria bacterium]|nr:hypothetical protein [Actinomycetota bacterium]